MALLDAVFAVAVPLVIVGVVVAAVALRYARTFGIYEGPDGAARRDDVNARYRTNVGAVVIAVLVVLLWGVTVADLFQRLGVAFATFVIAGLLVVPFVTIAAVIIMLYMFAVHAFAKFRG